MSKNIFKYPDTNSSRAKIEMINQKFEGLKICIIGTGGTGAYMLDLISKTPVSEIHIYDGDVFQLHNAFRAPGATPVKKFEREDDLYKVDYYHEIYSEMHNGIFPHREYITPENMSLLANYDFVFISVDKNPVRYFITNHLFSISVPFIDVGLGVNAVEGALLGSIRVTIGTDKMHSHLKERIGEDETDVNEYASNIQIADLNCMNATMAVIAWKRFVGFYQDLKKAHNSLYFINTGKLLNEDFGN
jgi:hypothetical protein